MKRISKSLILLFCLFLLAGCGRETVKHDKIKITTTIFPVYDWVCNIVGDLDNYEVRYLLDRGSDLHSFQPSSQDIVNIINSDLFIYVGGESEEWVNDVLKSKDAEGLKYINLLDALGSRALVEEEFGEDDDHEEGHHDEEYDEHIWLSLENASILCEQIAEKIISLDPSCEEKYRANLEEYGHELWLLKREYRDTFAGDGQKVIVVADRFPFAYLVNDYGIEYYAAFSGCSAESEASFETVVNLASKVDEYDLPVILHIESSDGSIAETVRKTTTNKDQQILMLNSLQAVSSEDIRNGVTYLKTMQENLEVLRKALNRE